MPQALLFVASAVAWGVLGGWIFRRPAARPAWPPAGLAPWGLVDLALAVLIWALGVGAAQASLLALDPGSAGGDLAQMSGPAAARWIAGLATVLLGATLLSALVVSWRSGARRVDWWGAPWPAAHSTLGNLARDLLLGTVAFVLLSGPVYGLQALLTQWFPSHHPLVDVVRSGSGGDVRWAVWWSAVGVAPLVEELQYRVLLQGLLKRIALSRGSVGAGLLGGRDTTPAQGLRKIHLPVIATALVFAAAHATHGPDCVPLLIFGWGLGELYERTGRLVPVWVTHVVLNAWSLTMLQMT